MAIFQQSRFHTLAILILVFFAIGFLFNITSDYQGEIKKVPKLTESLRSEHNCSCRQDESVKFSRNSFRDSSSLYEIRFLKNGEEVRKFKLIEEEFRSIRITCDRFNSFRRGPNLKVISYSLYGSNPFYSEKLLSLTQIIADKYPGWIMRVYYDAKTVDPSIICQIECAKKRDSEEFLDNADMCNINKISDGKDGSWNATFMHGTMWRWLPIGDSFVDVFSSRDTDSYILDREVASVNEWLNSETLFHIMRGNNLLEYF